MSQDQWLKLKNSNSTEIGLLASGDDLAIEKSVEQLPDAAHRQVRDFKEGRQMGGGSITLNELRPEDGIGEILYSLFGSVSTSGSGPYVHTFTPATIGTDLPTPTVIKQVGSVQEEYTGCKINEFTFEAVSDGTIEPETTVVATSATPTSGESEASYDNSKVFNADEGTATVGGTSFDLASIEFSFTNNIDDGDDTFALDGTAGHAKLPEGDFGLELSMDVITDDSTMVDALVNSNTKEVVVDIGASPTEVKLTVPKALVTDRGKSVETEGGVIVEDVDAVALYDTSASEDACKVELWNSITSYPRS
jgi:hypothetical protein